MALRRQSALRVEDARDFTLDGFQGRQASADSPAVQFTNVEQATVRNSRAAAGTGVFLEVAGGKSRGIRFSGNDMDEAKVPYRVDSGVRGDAVSGKDR